MNDVRIVGWRLALAALLLWTGCTDWPHLDYAASPLRLVEEVEGQDGERVQNLETLHGDVLVSGEIDSSVYVSVSDIERDVPFGLPGWYAGDMDWYQFMLRDPAAVRLQLEWDDGSGLLDLYFFVADSQTGELALLDYDATEGVTSRDRFETGLAADAVYVVAVAGHAGDGVAYDLLIHLEP